MSPLSSVDIYAGNDRRQRGRFADEPERQRLRDGDPGVPPPTPAANIRRGKRVLVLSDFDHDQRVWQAVMTILSDIGADATLALFERRPADYYDPPSAVAEAMLKSDFNILMASTGMLHASASFNAMAAGIPSICMDGGMTLEMFQSGAVTDDMRDIAVRKH